MRRWSLGGWLCLVVLAASPALAQNRPGTFEITPFAGAYFGGELERGSNAIFARDVDIATDVSYGLRLGYNVTPWFGMETGFMYVAADIEPDAGDDVLFGGGTTKLGEMEIWNYELNALFSLGHSRHVIPYFAIGGGATTFKPDVRNFPRDSDTRFSTILGFGVKFFVGPHFGFRFDGRAHGTYINDSSDCSHHDSYYCDGNSYYYYDDQHWYWSGEVTTGLTFAF